MRENCAGADTLGGMPVFTMREAAELLGVSDDTVRRWADAGRFDVVARGGGHRGVDGRELARFARSLATDEQAPGAAAVSARNRLVGIVTAVKRDTVMAQVEMQCGPYRIVSLMSREAADDLGLEPGVRALASIKSTNVVVELASERR
jgi:molybdopterin-binding protein